jgi:coenzyme F420-reducing hydrogenase gamma subunit
MPRTEDAAAEFDSSNATLCDNCCKALQKPLVCAGCKTATYCSKECQVHIPHRQNGGIGLKTVID